MIKKVFRAAYAKTPMSWRVKFGRMWRTRGIVDRLYCSEADVARVLGETNLFFLLGSGRCGTLLISRMLNRIDDAVVLHEPHRHCDLTVRPASRRDPAAARRFVEKFRKYEIYKKIRETQKPTYGEVSSPLRCLGAALRESMPNATFMILVRDGRATVRSALNRQAPRKGQVNHDPALPLPDDHPYVDEWDSMSDFERACWWWMDCYRMLRSHLPDAPIVHFEKITKDYDYLRERVLEPCGLALSQEQYNNAMGTRSANAAKEYTIPHWTDWDADMRASFDRICGDMMEEMGYEREW